MRYSLIPQICIRSLTMLSALDCLESTTGDVSSLAMLIKIQTNWSRSKKDKEDKKQKRQLRCIGETGPSGYALP